MQVRPATAADIPAMIDLERQCASAAHWSEQQYQQIFQPSENHSRESATFRRLALVISSNSVTNIIGFLIASQLDRECELENMAVAPDCRRQNLGTLLLSELLVQARSTGGESIFLEVRESNLPARALYKKFGFHETGRRRGYYASPSEDAVLFRYALP